MARELHTLVLGHQNESEQIVTPVRSQTLTLYSTQTVRFRTGVPSLTMISLSPCTKYLALSVFFGTHCIMSIRNITEKWDITVSLTYGATVLFCYK